MVELEAKLGTKLIAPPRSLLAPRLTLLRSSASVQKQLRTSLSQNQAQSPTHAPPISFDELGAASTSLSTAQIVYNALFPNPTSEQMSALNLYLAAQLSRVDLLHNIDHRLASQGLANSLALSLMEGKLETTLQRYRAPFLIPTTARSMLQ